MKFFLDHDVSAAVKDALVLHGYEVIQVTDALPGDSADEIVFITANRIDAC